MQVIGYKTTLILLKLLLSHLTYYRIYNLIVLNCSNHSYGFSAFNFYKAFNTFKLKKIKNAIFNGGPL